MEKIATENLFLLEFLVDNVNLDPKCDCAMGDGERCVSFQFLDNAPLDVCEEDFTPPQQNEKESIKSGKSCLFSLSPEQASGAIQQFDIYVTIFKKMPAGWLPERVEVGESLISIANLFSELINGVETSEGTTPAAKTLKDAFDIHNANAEVIGKIGVYIRMSCFGKLIVTQFQMNLDDKSVLFKDKEGKSLYRYKKAGKGSKKQDTCTARLPLSQGGNNNPPGSLNQRTPQMQEQCYTNNQPPMDPYMGGAYYGQGQNQGGNFQCPINSCGFYPGMGDMNMRQQSPCQECGALTNAPCFPTNQNMPQTNFGAYPGYYNQPGGQHVPSCLVPHEETVNPNPPNTPQNALKPEENPLELPIVEVCGEKQEDENKEVFLLKIGKKKMGNDKNPKLELEMCTPRGKDFKPIPRKETRETQYDPADAAGAEPRGKKGDKGQKGKGKKKK